MNDQSRVPRSGLLRYEKNDTVLWVATDSGILLHNFLNHTYLELSDLAAIVWEYLDGAHTEEDIVERVSLRSDLTISETREFVVSQVSKLAERGFLQIREAPP